MKKETKILPKLRFPEFVSNNNWISSKLSDYENLVSGDGDWILSENITKNGEYKIVQLSNIGFGEFNKKILKTISAETFNELNGTLIHKGDLLINRMVDSNKINCCIFPLSGKYVTSVDVCWIRQNQFFDNYFFMYLISSGSNQIKLLRLSSGAGRVRISKKNLFEQFSFLIPSHEEQQKIASCLSSLDNLITAHKEKLEALKNHKKGLMQNLFPQEGEKVPKYRFPEFQNDGDWMEKKLGEIGEFIGGGTPSTSNPEYWNGNIQWYTPTEVKTFNLTKSVRSITEKGLKNSSAKLLPIGSILITTRATIGDAAITKWECSTNQGFQSLVVNKNQLNSFWYYWILNNKQEFLRRSSGSTFKEIGKTELEIIPTISPSIKEQQKIASCLLEVDNLIQAQETKIAELQYHKKGLMQGLFPKLEN